MNPQQTGEESLRTLHNVYSSLTGQQPPFAFCERRWFEWQKHFAMDDLKLAIDHALRINKKRQPQYQIPFRFNSFIGDLERFSDLIGDARADKRARDFKAKHSYPAAKAEVLRATGRPDAPVVPEGCMSAKEALQRMRETL